jgi:hypothetical protein
MFVEPRQHFVAMGGDARRLRLDQQPKVGLSALVLVCMAVMGTPAISSAALGCEGGAVDVL